MKRLKKTLFVAAVVALLVFFTLPAVIFGESSSITESDDEFKVIIDNTDLSQQYVEGTSNDGPSGDIDGEKIPVLCIDAKTLTYVGNPYKAEGLTDDEALLLLSTLQTGADSRVDQLVAWHYTDDVDAKSPSTYSGMPDATRNYINAASAEQKDEVKEIISQIDSHVQNGKKVEDFNNIVVELDEKPLGIDKDGDGIIKTGSDEVIEHTATATMENPFITTKKDVDDNVITEGTANHKDVYWYILDGSYNVSFDQYVLVTEFKSVEGMEDIDGKGVATQNYYYFWWGEGFIQNVMAANIFAWVDLNGNGKLDAPYTAEDSFKKVEKVLTVGDGDEKQIKIDGDGNVETSPVFDNGNVKYHLVEGGRVLKTTLSNKRQVLLTESEKDPYGRAYVEYVAGTITVNKTDPTGAPLAGAVFNVFNVIDNERNLIVTLTTDEYGKASFTGLIAGDYEIIEFKAPEGYAIDAFPKDFSISLENSVEEKALTNTPNPPIVPPTEDPEEEFGVEGVTDIIQVAGTTRTSGKIEVLGVAELPYTGMNPMVIFAGIALLIGLSITGLAVRKKVSSK